MADGDALLLGRQNTSSAETRITRSGAANVWSFVVESGNGHAVVGGSGSQHGVWGGSQQTAGVLQR
jgi:hypothetical protein